MTGGTERHKLVGQDQFLMVFFISVYPDADADEVATYIVNNGGNVYDRQTISKRLQELEFTRKRASTEAYQAFLPHNILRVQRFWSLPPPVGVANVRRRMLVDVDECGGIALEKMQSKLWLCSLYNSSSQTRALYKREETYGDRGN